MLIPVELIAVFLSAFGSLVILVAGWGYSVVRKNTAVVDEMLRTIIELKQKDADDELSCREKHRVINDKLREHSCVLKEHERNLIILNTIHEMEKVSDNDNVKKK